MLRSVVFRVSLLMMLCPCVVFAGSDDPKLEKMQEELDKIASEMEQALLKGDYEALLTFYTDDAVVMADFRPTIEGKAKLRQTYKEGARQGIKTHSITGTTRELWIAGDKVYQRGTFGTAVSSKENPRALGYYGSYFQIWEKQPDGRLLLDLVIWNLDFYPC